MSWFRSKKKEDDDSSLRPASHSEHRHAYIPWHGIHGFPIPGPDPPVHPARSEGSAGPHLPSPVHNPYPSMAAPAPADFGAHIPSELAAAENAEIQRAIRESADEYAAKGRASLHGLQRSISVHSMAESLSYQYWSQGSVQYKDALVDGFYDICGDFPEVADQDKFPSLDALKLVRTPEGDVREVILIDHRVDSNLVSLERHAAEAVAEAAGSHGGLQAQIEALATVVSNCMGGKFDTEDALTTLWMAASATEKKLQRSAVLPLGRISTGTTRHRAILFKLLADSLNIKSQLLRGKYLGRSDDTAVNTVKLKGKEWLVDLVLIPGRLISPEDAGGIQKMDFGPGLQSAGPSFAGSSIGSMFSAGPSYHSATGQQNSLSSYSLASGASASSLHSESGSSQTRIAHATSAQPPVETIASVRFPVVPPQTGLRQPHCSSAPASGSPQSPHRPRVREALKDGGIDLIRLDSDGDLGGVQLSGIATQSSVPESWEPFKSVESVERHGSSGYHVSSSGRQHGVPSSIPGLYGSGSSAQVQATRSEQPCSQAAAGVPVSRTNSGRHQHSHSLDFSQLPSYTTNGTSPLTTIESGLPIDLDVGGAFTSSGVGTSMYSTPPNNESHKPNPFAANATPFSFHSDYSASAASQHPNAAAAAAAAASPSACHESAPPSSFSSHGDFGSTPLKSSLPPPKPMPIIKVPSWVPANHVFRLQLQNHAPAAPMSASQSQNRQLPGQRPSFSTPGGGGGVSTPPGGPLGSDPFAELSPFTSSLSNKIGADSQLSKTSSLCTQDAEERKSNNQLPSSGDPSVGMAGSTSSGGADAAEGHYKVQSSSPFALSDVANNLAKSFGAFGVSDDCVASTSAAAHQQQQQHHHHQQHLHQQHPHQMRGSSAAVGQEPPEAFKPTRPASTSTGMGPPMRRSEEAGMGAMSILQSSPSFPLGVGGSHRDWEIEFVELEFGQRIGIGSYGEVYKGTWRGTEVAIKKLLEQNLCPASLRDFRDEVSVMSRLRHPNIVLFLGAVVEASQLAIVTAFVPRGSLFRILHRAHAALDPRRRLAIAMDIAKGMCYLHSCKPMIVHRDLKSPNLLVDKDWTIKICDFGLSQVKGATFLTARSAGGTPEWMAPEVLRNESSDEKCDVYSYGVILYELVVLSAPWAHLNSMQVVGAVGFGGQHLDLPDDLAPEVAALIESCWEDKAQDRPSFAAILKTLASFSQLAPSPSAFAAVVAQHSQT